VAVEAAVHLGEIILGLQVVEVVAVVLLLHIKLHPVKYFQVVQNMYPEHITFTSIHLLAVVKV
jgi:hypothetical protein